MKTKVQFLKEEMDEDLVCDAVEEDKAVDEQG
jgi:hypothetical protein